MCCDRAYEGRSYPLVIFESPVSQPFSVLPRAAFTKASALPCF